MPGKRRREESDNDGDDATRHYQYNRDPVRLTFPDVRDKLEKLVKGRTGDASQTSSVAKDDVEWTRWATLAGVVLRPDCDADDFKGLILRKEDVPCIDTDALKIDDTDGADMFRCKPYLTALHDDLRSFPDDRRATRLKIDSKLSRQYLEVLALLHVIVNGTTAEIFENNEATRRTASDLFLQIAFGSCLQSPLSEDRQRVSDDKETLFSVKYVYAFRLRALD
ncbi:hypothetical protein EUX98_g6630 [Antrodiella citrinella]|uniref:Uncharacterized protein n=1 Tax=Antrodiella citrinella TaxID=2447956 RepID=A0A4S4MPB8_9APHY|nr:hypothetical protein EUX98_g6630 [Antrodiella citrinella]